jgi:precorrin-6A/cobalt-precorrin-6A reductase
MARSSVVPRRVLILGGSAEARALASLLIGQGHEVITSLAGRTSAPLLPEGKVRSGGFGGSNGMERFIRNERIEIIADATHPFAVQISANGLVAARACGIKYVRLERPAWRPEQGDSWTMASDVAEAARLLPQAARVFLTIGRKEIGAFTQRADLGGLIRMIEPPNAPVPAKWSLALGRPPFTVETELSLMRCHRISVLVTKNAGGEQTAAKLIAARRLSLPVMMIERPVKPEAFTAATLEEMAVLVSSRTAPPPAPRHKGEGS